MSSGNSPNKRYVDNPLSSPARINRPLSKPKVLFESAIPRLSHTKPIPRSSNVAIGLSPPRKRQIMSPIRRSGSPERRQIIHQLENPGDNAPTSIPPVTLQQDSPSKLKRVKFNIDTPKLPDSSDQTELTLLRSLESRITTLEDNQMRILSLLESINEKLNKS